jgi:hypothetical protein
MITINKNKSQVLKRAIYLKGLHNLYVNIYSLLITDLSLVCCCSGKYMLVLHEFISKVA